MLHYMLGVYLYLCKINFSKNVITNAVPHLAHDVLLMYDTKIHLWLCGSAKCFPPASCCEHWLAFHVMRFVTQHFVTSIEGVFCDLKMKPKCQSVLHTCNFPKAHQTFSNENVSRTSELLILYDFSWHCRPRVLFCLPILGGFLTKQFKI